MSRSRAISVARKPYVEADGDFGVPGAQLTTVRDSFPEGPHATETAFSGLPLKIPALHLTQIP